jgi:hypothetical protein
MLDTRIDSIIYQSQIYYRDLVNELTEEKKLGKAYDCEWQKADLILAYLESLNYVDRLTDEDDRTNVTYILECLINLCELNQYPVSAPITFQEPPAVIVGVAGSTGATGNTGATGATGLATDIQVSLISVPTVADSFTLASAKGARWDYIVIKSTGEQRAGQVIGTWLDDGSALEIFDTSTDDITGSTDALTFSVEYLAPNIRLIATPASGIWNIVATRYFIPNNGNGSGPVSDVLPDGQVYIGNASNVATARTLSGAITTTNTGVTSLGSGVIVNANISASAAIVMSKLEALTASRVAVTDGSGVITTSDRTTTELNQLAGIVGAVVSSTSSSPRFLIKEIQIGDWNMDTTQFVSVAHGIADYTKIRAVLVVIRNDAATLLLEIQNPAGALNGTTSGGITSINSVNVDLYRVTGGSFDSTNYDATSFNRGYITIIYSV